MKQKPITYTAAVVVVVFIFGVYLHTMNPVFKNNDSPETAAAAYTLGIAHPPAYPLHTMAGKIACLPSFASPAFRMNVFSSFLGMIILYMTYRILIMLNINIFGSGMRIWAGAGAVLTAFSYIFWNQGTEAKGSIYMLNLLFLAVIIFSMLKAKSAKTPVYIYMSSYIYGLSLSNHWPSMIILAPVFASCLYIFRKKTSGKNYIISALFFLAGLTPYLFLVIRSSSDPVFNWGDPSSGLSGFLWVVLRRGYVNPVTPSADVYLYQVKHFLYLFAVNFSVLCVFLPAGIYAGYKRARGISVLLAAAAFIIIFAVVFLNRTQEGVIWLIYIFLMPAVYLAGLFISAGIAYIYTRIRGRRYKKLFIVLAAAGGVLMFWSNFIKNDYKEDYLSYDYGYNILRTVEKDGVYIADGDYNLMPLYYIMEVQKRRKDVKFATSSFIIFDWGIEDFSGRYGDIKMTPFKTAENIAEIVRFYSPDEAVYRSSYLPEMEHPPEGFVFSQKGILLRISKKQRLYGPDVFERYSYRGVFEDFARLTKNNNDLIGWYPVSMVNQANALNASGYPEEAVKLYKKALLFPVDKPESMIFYNIALAYSNLDDFKNEMKYLILAAEKEESNPRVFEHLGGIYFNLGIFEKAGENLKKAVSMGSENSRVAALLKSLKESDNSKWFEIAMAKLTEMLSKGEKLTQNEYRKAEYIADFLLENDYKEGIIYRNLGVFYFQTKRYEKALENFKKAKNETNSAELYSFEAYVYYTKGNKKQALNVLDRGIKTFPEDSGLLDLRKQIKGE
ncbi:MAG: protein O-mannosyl-transferase family [Candidatus Goldiibacteriota bacterium]